MIWAVFVPRGAEGQKMAVRLLGQVDAPGASRALAFLALMSASAEVRQEAAQILRQRDARDFAPFLIGLIRDPIEYRGEAGSGAGPVGRAGDQGRDDQPQAALLAAVRAQRRHARRATTSPWMPTGLPVLVATPGIFQRSGPITVPIPSQRPSRRSVWATRRHRLRSQGY